jgi:hypothetical protein
MFSIFEQENPQVVVSKEEAEGPWQRGVAYKGFAGDITDLKNIPSHVIDSKPFTINPKPYALNP